MVVSEDPALSAAAPASALRAASWDIEWWVAAVRTVLAKDPEARPTREPVRQWADVAEETLNAIRTR